jgi:tight adherence protein C
MLDTTTFAAFALLTIATFAIGSVVSRLARNRSARALHDRLDTPITIDDELEPAVAPLGALTDAMASQVPQPQADVPLLERDLRRAGRYAPTARRDFLAVRNALVLLTLFGFGLLLVLAGPDHSERTFQIVVAGLAAAALVYVLPRLALKLKGKQRVAQIERGLSDALDMISMCVTGGLSFQAALARVSREMHFSHPELARELAIIQRQASVSTLGQALQQFAERVDGAEVKTMTLLVTQAERLGTDIVAALREYADGLRRSHRQRAEERANKTGVRLLFPLVLCLVPSVFLLLWGPAVLEIRDFIQDQTGIGGSLAQQISDELDAAVDVNATGGR